jgi:hypothetical protein
MASKGFTWMGSKITHGRPVRISIHPDAQLDIHLDAQWSTALSFKPWASVRASSLP